MTAAPAPDIHVAAGVLQNDHGHILVAQRPASAPLAGAWEFPGGKICGAETPLQGLIRELREELNIDVRYVRHLVRYSHTEHQGRVWLYVWRVLHWGGMPHGAEGQALRWLPAEELMQEGLLPADEPIVHSLLRPVAVNTYADFRVAAASRRI